MVSDNIRLFDYSGLSLLVYGSSIAPVQVSSSVIRCPNNYAMQSTGDCSATCM